MLSVADQMLYSATKLSTFNGVVPIGSGTGFFYKIKLDDEREIVTIVTNKHVIKNSDRVDVTLHLGTGAVPATPSGKFMQWELHFSENGVIHHPEPDVDLCALPVGAMIHQVVELGHLPFWVQHSNETVPSSEEWANFDSVVDVAMIGCPRGLFDTENNLPIIRRGSSASDIAKNYQGRNEFLIDLACFPGSSGSPVFLYDRYGGFDRKSGSMQIGRMGFYLLGILYSGPVFTHQGEIILSRRPTFEVATMMHLGQVIRSTALLEIENIVVQHYQKTVL